MRRTIVPVTFRQACEFIATYHRHHRPPRGMKFAVGIRDENRLVGVAPGLVPVAPLPARPGWTTSSRGRVPE
jgi:hypothetical protein